MKKLLINLLFLHGAALTALPQTTEKDLPILKMTLYPNAEVHLKKIIDNKPIEHFNNFSHPNIRRDLVDSILISKAITLGGYAHTIEYISSPNHTRSLLQIKAGMAEIMSETVWLHDADPEKVYISEPIIESGWIEKGIYCLEKRKDVQNVKTIDDLRKFTTLSSSNWKVDWNTIKSLDLPVHDVTQTPSMFRMIERGYADYLFLPFQPSPDLARRVGATSLMGINSSEHYLQPVNGLKLKLPGSRHFVVSKKAPNADLIFNALQRGIKLLKQKGQIKQAYIDCGFINQAVQDWKVLNP